MKNFRVFQRIVVSALIVSVAFWLSDCGRRLGGVEQLSIEKLGNGYLFRIQTEHPVGDVSAVVGPGNWVLITVADSSLDTTRIASFRSSLVDSVEIQYFHTAFQFSLHFTTRIDRLEVIHKNPGREILISLFQDEEKQSWDGRRKH